jgi:hypothetical protein
MEYRRDRVRNVLSITAIPSQRHEWTLQESVERRVQADSSTVLDGVATSYRLNADEQILGQSFCE